VIDQAVTEPEIRLALALDQVAVAVRSGPVLDLVLDQVAEVVVRSGPVLDLVLDQVAEVVVRFDSVPMGSFLGSVASTPGWSLELAVGMATGTELVDAFVQHLAVGRANRGCSSIVCS